ncbi:MAG: hypothetical protein GF311_12845 [Candidatus Lokiarchaeota archaeon]|nr:hypothetical protein [Candidatus Lokiarchaeota archaeon]
MNLNPNNDFFNHKKKIIKIIYSSLEDLCECQREKHIQDILARRLKCKSRITITSERFPDIEIDLLGDDFIMEVKYNEKYYSGFGQILVQKILYNYSNNYLIHIHEYLDSKFIGAFNKLSKESNISGILINKRKKQIEVIT